MKRQHPVWRPGARWTALVAFVALAAMTAWGARHAGAPHVMTTPGAPPAICSEPAPPATAGTVADAGVANVPTAAPSVTERVSPPSAHRQPAPASQAGTPGSAGMIVAVDPETGALGMPSPEQVRELTVTDDPAVSRSTTDLVEIRKPDGTVGINLQGRFQDYVVVRVGPDGKPFFRCVQGAADARRALQDTLPPPRVEEE